MKYTFLLPAALLIAATVSGCKPATDLGAEPTAAPGAAATPVDSSANAPTASGVVFSADPAGLEACEKAPKVVTLKWDARAVAGVHDVEIWASRPAGDPKLFTHSGAVGEKQTGAWVQPGSLFFLKDPASGAELSHLEVAAIPCP
jgi:hypothetical protein